MKRIKQIIEAIKVLGLNPSTVLVDCVTRFDDMTNDTTLDISESDKVRIRIMRQVMDAVAVIAGDMGKPAKSEAGEVKP